MHQCLYCGTTTDKPIVVQVISQPDLPHLNTFVTDIATCSEYCAKTVREAHS